MWTRLSLLLSHNASSCSKSHGLSLLTSLSLIPQSIRIVTMCGCVRLTSVPQIPVHPEPQNVT